MVSKFHLKYSRQVREVGGLRSLSSISPGSFICENNGNLLDGEEAENRENDEYLFDIGGNYCDEEIWDGIKPVDDLQSSTSSSGTMKGFTIDGAECSNVGRFINHSCSPNLYAQNVLWDHGDMRMPHIMLFAVGNIPPLQKLTYHYNYKVGSVYNENGNEKANIATMAPRIAGADSTKTLLTAISSSLYVMSISALPSLYPIILQFLWYF